MTSPAAGDVVDDLVAATWEASDDTVAVLLEHSSDGGATWDVLAAGWTDEAYTLDPDRLPASAEDGSSLLRVTASNGSSSATATSSGFTVVGGEGEAPAVWITSPPDDHAYRSTGGHLVLDADGHHADLDVLDGEALVWESDLDGHLGTGRLVEGLASLSEGTHTITVTTTDSQGRSASDSVTVTIDPHEPALAVTVDGREEIDEDASLEGPVTITIDADAVGGSPLATVGYSLDGGETHAEVDLRALPYAVTVEEGDVHLVVYATDVADNQAVESRRFTVAAEG